MQSGDWNKLKFLERTTNLKAVIKQRTGKLPPTEIARDIAACLQQGRLFFEIADSASLQVQPLRIYYGIVGFAKAIILARNVQSIATIAQSQGCPIYLSKPQKWKTYLFSFRGEPTAPIATPVRCLLPPSSKISSRQRRDRITA